MTESMIRFDKSLNTRFDNLCLSMAVIAVVAWCFNMKDTEAGSGF